MNENDDNNNDINFDDEIPYLPIPKLELKKIEIYYKPKIMEKIKMTEIRFNNYGVENLKKVGVAIAALINAGLESKSDDGKITFTDIAHFIKVVPDVLAAIPAIPYLKNELNDKITDEELKNFTDTILPLFNFKNNLDKEFIEKILSVVRDISELITNRKAKSGTESTS